MQQETVATISHEKFLYLSQDGLHEALLIDANTFQNVAAGDLCPDTVDFLEATLNKLQQGLKEWRLLHNKA